MMRNILSKYLTPVIKPFVDIRPEERMKTLLMFLYFMLTISVLYILKPVRSALFLSEFGAEKIRFANIGEGIFLIFVVWAYAEIAKRIPRKMLYPGVLIFLISNLIIFWILSYFKTPYLSAAFYVWQSSFSAMITTQFWILANDIFNPKEGKRLFGIIISGGSIGGILGGAFTHMAVKFIRVEDLFLVVVLVLVICVFLIKFLWKEIPNVDSHTSAESVEEETGEIEDKEKAKKVLKAFTKSSYLIMIAGVVIIAKMSATIIDNQFGGVVQAAIHGKEALASFYGGFYSFLNAISFVLQLIVTSKLLKKFGVGGSVFILPVGLSILSLISALNPILIVGILFKLYDGSVNYSVQQASKEILYLPISSKVRRQVKPVIDMLGYRGAKTLAGIYMAVMAPFLGLSVDKIGVLILTLMPLWFFIVWKIKKVLSKHSEAGL